MGEGVDEFGGHPARPLGSIQRLLGNMPPRQKLRATVEVKLLSHGNEVYVLAKSQAGAPKKPPSAAANLPSSCAA